MIEQYLGMKAKHPEAILLSRVGDFYEAYGDDAETISRLLQIALTSKEAGGGSRIAMAGVPHHALDGYLAKLVAQQRIVALAEQLEAPVPNRLVRRDIVRVVTPGTLIEENWLERGQNNYLAALTACGETIGVAHADISTGRAAATAYAGQGAIEDVIAELVRVAPAEIVADLPSEMRDAIAQALPGVRVTAPPLAAVAARDRGGVPGFSLDESLAMRRALEALEAFVRRVGFAVESAPFREPDWYRAQTFLALDANTRKHLELTKALGANPKATLLASLDRCRTSMGSRLLARWIVTPLIDRGGIEARADKVEVLVRDHVRRSALQGSLGGLFDLERIAQKIRFRRAAPRDLASLRRTLALLDPLRAQLPAALSALGERIGEFRDVLGSLERTLVDEPPATLVDGGVVRPEASAELAECVALRGDVRGRLTALEERERARTGIKNLKVKYASAFGYSIEVSNANLASVPAEYVRKQTLTNAERFVTQELKDLEAAISSAQARQLRLEAEIFAALVEELAGRVDDLLATAEVLAELDVYCGLAQVAAEHGYVRPAFVDASRLEIKDGRHPVVEHLVGTRFVPNDVRIEPDADRFILLTGPNMGGKSTYLRQSALLAIMAQIGSFVPAKAMTLGVVDRIFTRIGAGDDLASGQSTFFVEMTETSNIVRRCTARSLLVIDEVGRGTGTIDGLAIAQAICEYLLDLGADAPMVLFATHFHELVALADRWPLVANYHVTAVESTAKSGAPVFSHRVLPGSTSRSFGIEVARMAGLPAGVIARAREIAQVLEERPTLEVVAPLRGHLSGAGREEQQLALDL